MTSPANIPTVQLIGQANHPDFRDAIDLLRSEACLVDDATLLPELVVVAHSRPDAMRTDELDSVRRASPLASIVALLGSWCEGEMRTGRPWPGAHRVFWYEFPAWWARQMHLRATGQCPDWARPVNFGLRTALGSVSADCGFSTTEPGRINTRVGLVIVRTPVRESAEAISAVLDNAGYATAWQRPGRYYAPIRGAMAGVWDGGQLNAREALEIAELCDELQRDGAPVVALLDFPRRDSVDRALQIGAAAVLGKPWMRSELLAVLEAAVVARRQACAA
ncbi:MAG TPA: hypothetical protein VFW73_02660 [Lacipirellulaceae bacterium]|nr:hypothetical protein [Lacipirellulaceae bacterium]